MPLPLHRLAWNPCFIVRGDAVRPVHARQWYEGPGRDDGVPEIWCYTDRLSYEVGETVTLHAIATVCRMDVLVHAASTTREPMFRRNAIAVCWADTPHDASVAGCHWPATVEFRIGSDWPSGVYLVTALASRCDREVMASHLFIVRPWRTPARNRLLLITADATWNAYNDWGGSNHYEGIVDPDGNRFSPRLSNQRPLARGLVHLPADAPRTLPQHPPDVTDPIRYPHMAWAWDNGYSKKYASAGWASYERHFARWAAARGYGLDVATQQDLHFRPEILDGVACVVMVGHDEYWSWRMRDAIDDYVERGGGVARFAGNFMWQIRLENHGTTQVCYKYLARQEDPCFASHDRHLSTTSWEAREVGRPGRATFGLDASRGLYAGWGGLAPRGADGFTVYRPEHWAFADARLGYGDILGAGSRIFGYEVDGLDYRIEDGLPYPVVDSHLPDGLSIIAMGLARLREDGFGESPDRLFVADDDARFIAEIRFGKTDEATLDRVDRGSGMVVHFPKGQGEVFHAGTTEWVAGLIRGDHAVEQVTRNVLDRFLARVPHH